MRRNLDTALLRSFVSVAELGSMTGAARALNLTQGAVSQQVRRLEEALGCGLFERRRGGLRLTADGERLLGRAQRLLLLNDEIWSEMAAERFVGPLRIGVPYDLVGSFLAPAIKSFAEACPGVEVSLSCDASPELARQLEAGALDLAVVEEPLGGGAGERLRVDRLVWVGARAGSAYLKRPLPVSLVADSCAFRPFVLEALRRDGRAWRSVFEQGNIEATATTVRTDLAVTAWLAFTVPADLEILGPDSGLPALPDFSVNLRLPRGGATPAAEEFARHLRGGAAGRRAVA
ncbi:transcriptional regulator, LysR family [Tistlia consotensis]|uniref:Transcriptional regulator, LysR family n=1 Tax=Tistlia consotensis USBA 355 TaxID=560819 RepID=A0A1Y6CMQ4_9PROT|nr:LysR family transcriptional regulator [Tistlia consotensis]SMF60392.1 transcriptional regulator, LysR family [Tistlia consotensis USBA 355]SNR93436.1 transcriptional regulator, LysR family [Tistlia consotensis]